MRHDYQALVDATQVVTGERDRLQERIAELEACNKRLVDLVWGRRSERRSPSSDQQSLDFGDGEADPPSAAEQEIIEVRAKADQASDEELLRRLRQRREARAKKKLAEGRREEFPASFSDASGCSTSPKRRKRV